MRTWASWLVALLLGAGPGGAAAGLLTGSRVEDMPEPARQAMESFAGFLRTGDRASALALLAPESRLSATPLLAQLLATPRQPRAELQVLVAGWQAEDGGLEARAIFRARVQPVREAGSSTPGSRQELGYQAIPLSLRWRSGDGALVVEAGEPASVVAARVEWRLDAEAERLRVRSELDLQPEVSGVEWASLSLPSGTDRVSVVGVDDEPLWLRPDEEGAGGRLLLRLPAPQSTPFRLTIEHEAAIPVDIRAGGDTLYLSHGAVIAPWAGGRFHLWDLTLDIPAELRGVSVGRATKLEAPEGRRRIRYATSRLIDYPGLAVGHFRVDKRGPLELWRVAQVGGSAEVLLGELSQLVDFHEERVAPLPYGAFRLVEVDMSFAGAVSYASVIFMKTAVMAQAKQRFSILSHEVAHQWWGNAVQGDQHTRWISEGMANALMDLFVAHVEGEDAKQDLLDKHRQQTLNGLKPGALPLAHVRGRPEDCYQRGALFVHALREAVGDETFWRILQAWYGEHAGPEVGTPALRATAERAAGRSLGEVFEPWLGSTALPVLDFEWSVQGAVAKLRIEQEEPFFRLEVPVEAMLPGGLSEWKRVQVGGAVTQTTWELAVAPLALRLDPKELTSRVRDPERLAYWLGEAGACLARGEHERGLALLEKAEGTGAALPAEAVKWRATALALEGRGEESDAAIEEDLAGYSRDAVSAASLERIDGLLAAGRAALGLKLSDELAKSVEDGAALHLRRAHALRMLGREAEAEAAWGRALAERPGNEAARLALGRPAVEEDEEVETLLDDEDQRLAGNHPFSVRLLVASRNRWGLVLPGSRRILLGQGDEIEGVPDYSPPGLVDAAIVEAESARPLVVALEAGRRRGRLTVIEVDERGRGSVKARHDRAGGKAQRVLSDGSRVHVAWTAREGGLDWYRFLPDLRGDGTPGPDDRDGLVTLKPKSDPRFEFVGRTPDAERVVLLADGSFAWIDARGLLQSEAGVLWEQLEGEAWEAIHLRSAGSGAGLVLSGDMSESPFAEDSLAERRLVVVGPERFVERRLPDDALDAVLAPDGSVLVLRGSAGCSATELSVSLLPPLS